MMIRKASQFHGAARDLLVTGCRGWSIDQEPVVESKFESVGTCCFSYICSGPHGFVSGVSRDSFLYCGLGLCLQLQVMLVLCTVRMCRLMIR